MIRHTFFYLLCCCVSSGPTAVTNPVEVEIFNLKICNSWQCGCGSVYTWERQTGTAVLGWFLQLSMSVLETLRTQRRLPLMSLFKLISWRLPQQLVTVWTVTQIRQFRTNYCSQLVWWQVNCSIPKVLSEKSQAEKIFFPSWRISKHSRFWTWGGRQWVTSTYKTRTQSMFHVY